MKILIILLMTLFISSNVYSASKNADKELSEKIIRDGDVIAYGLDEYYMKLIVNYIDKTYRCRIETMERRPSAHCRELYYTY